MLIELTSKFFDKTVDALFPIRKGSFGAAEVPQALEKELLQILESNYFKVEEPKRIAGQFIDRLPEIKKILDGDITATLKGDPAAKSEIEIILTYPGFYGIAAYRIAHELHISGVELIPRIITEYAHQKTGIDIHPGAKIGHSFCIDHGTGIVIGETAEIGNNVKIYQGVTIGALSTREDTRNTKRHPTIEDDVVIYAQATILGGKTTVGKGSIIGGNTWITKSIPPFSKVIYQQQSIQQLFQQK